MPSPAIRKRLIVVALILSVAVVFILAGALFYLNSAALRNMVLDRVNSRIRGSVIVKSHHLSWHFSRLVVRDLTVRDARGKNLVSAGRVDIVMFWPALLRREIDLPQVLIREAALDLSFDSSNRLALAEALTPPPEVSQKTDQPGQPLAWQVRVGRLRLEASSLTYAQPAAGRSGRVDGIDIQAALDPGARKGSAQGRIDRLVFASTAGKQRINGLTLDASYNGTNARPLRATLAAGQSELSVEGRLAKSAEQLKADGSAALRLDLAEWASLLPNISGLTGLVNAKAEVSGALDDPDVSLNLDLDQATLDRFTLARLRANLTMHARRISVQRLEAQDQWGSLELTGDIDLQPVFARGFGQRTGALDDLTYRLNLRGRDIAPEKVAWWNSPFKAVLQTDLKVEGTGISPANTRASADIGIQAGGFKTAAMARPVKGLLQGRARWQARTLTIAQAKASAGSIEAALHGDVHTASSALDLSGSLSVKQMTDVGDLFGIGLPGGQATLNLNARGPFRQPTLKATLLAENLVLGQHPLGRVLAEARLDEKAVVHLPRLVLENQGSLVRGKARIDLKHPDGAWQADPGLWAELTFEKLQPADFGLQLPVRADLTGRLSLGGTFKHPQASSRLENSQLAWQSLEGRLDGNLNWRDGRLEADQVRWARDASRINLRGSAVWRDSKSGQWTAKPGIEVSCSVADLNLADVREGWSGTLNGQGRAAGPVTDLSGTFEVMMDKVEASGQKIRQIALAGRLAGATLHLDRMEAVLAAGQTLDGRGWISKDQHFQISLQSRALDLMHIEALQKAYPVDGRLTMQLDGRGSFAHPDIRLTMKVEKPRFKDLTLEDFSVTAHLLERRLDLEANLNFAIKARADLSSGDFNLAARLDQTDLTPYLALWAGSDWAGQTSGQVTLTGNWRDPAAIQGNLTLTNASLVYNHIDLAVFDRLTLNLSEGRLALPAARITLMQEGYLEVSASGPLGGALVLDLDSRLPLAALAPFIDQVGDMQGVLLLKAQARGALSALRWQADLSMEQVGFILPQLDQSIRALQGHISLNQDQIAIDNLTCKVDSGGLSMNGTLQWSDFKPTAGALTLEARALPLQWPGHLDAVVNGTLKLSGRKDKALLQGKLVLLEGTYYKDVRLNLLSALTTTRRPNTGPAPSQSPPWMEKIALDIKLTHRSPFLVDNNVARLQIAPDLSAGGTLAHPVLSGRAQVIEGEVIYRRKSFTVKRGVVDFINPYKTEPVLDIVSQVQIRKWLVTLTVSGTPDELAIGLSSDPSESDNDILSLILIGRTNRELTQGEGGGQRSTEQMLAALVSTAWGEDIKRSAGVDILEVETGSQPGEAESDRIQVTVGKQLSRRLTVKYEVETSEGETVQRAVSEYRFLENLLASGFQDSQGQYGAELLFRMEF